MLNMLNLVWPFVLGVFVGAFILSFFTGASQSDREYEAYRRGYRKGVRKYMGMLEITGGTLGELYISNKNELDALMLNNEVELIKETENGQLEFAVFNNYEEFNGYFDCVVTEVSESAGRLIILIKD